MNKNKEIFIQKDETILSAIKQMDSIGRKLLVVLDGNQFYSLISIGDIQRAIISNIDLITKISFIIRSDVKVASDSDDLDKVKNNILKNQNEFMPIVSVDNKVIDIIFLNQLSNNQKFRKKSNLNIPVVIMAGGKGTRLKPITNILPKPLIPIGKKTILEEIMDRFIYSGCNHFMISVNYKSKMIKDYFNSLDDICYDVEYFEEEKPLGTAGSMYLLKKKINSTFFVSNCDIIIDQDLEEIYNYHKENNNSITIVSALKHYKIPYGTIETGENGALESLLEKPELTFQINSGMYILEPEILEYIPENTFFHITELIDDVMKDGCKVGAFPVSEGSWKDIGEWNQYIMMANNGKK